MRYLGSNVPAPFIVDKLSEEIFDILALSCASSFNLRYVKETIALVRGADVFSGSLIVGGRVFNLDRSLKDDVKADYHGIIF